MAETLPQTTTTAAATRAVRTGVLASTAVSIVTLLIATFKLSMAD
jgi:hypothetical protein